MTPVMTPVQSLADETLLHLPGWTPKHVLPVPSTLDLSGNLANCATHAAVLPGADVSSCSWPAHLAAS